MKTAYISFDIVPDDKNYYHESYVKNKRVEFEDGKLFESIKEFALNNSTDGFDRFDISKPTNMYINDGELIGFIFRYTCDYENSNGKLVKKHGDVWCKIYQILKMH